MSNNKWYASDSLQHLMNGGLMLCEDYYYRLLRTEGNLLERRKGTEDDFEPCGDLPADEFLWVLLGRRIPKEGEL